MVGTPSVSCVHWISSWRLVPSRFPPAGLFDRVTDDDDLEAVIAIESLTNDRLRDEIGDIRLVPQDERQFGPGTTPIMASFTHINPEGSRFSDGNYGLYYAANNVDTALAETRYHRERFLLRTLEPPIEIDMRSYRSEINTQLHDIRNMQKSLSAVYDETSYDASQKLARDLRNDGSNGIVYDSVRHTEGECVGIFRANIPQPVTQGAHYCFQWDGSRIANTYRKTAC
jgi:hypothetical protein